MTGPSSGSGSGIKANRDSERGRPLPSGEANWEADELVEVGRSSCWQSEPTYTLHRPSRRETWTGCNRCRELVTRPRYLWELAAAVLRNPVSGSSRGPGCDGARTL